MGEALEDWDGVYRVGDVIKLTSLNISKRTGVRHRGSWVLSGKRTPVWAVFAEDDYDENWTILCGGNDEMQKALIVHGPTRWAFGSYDGQSEPIPAEQWPDEVIAAIARVRLLGEA